MISNDTILQVTQNNKPIFEGTLLEFLASPHFQDQKRKKDSDQIIADLISPGVAIIGKDTQVVVKKG